MTKPRLHPTSIDARYPIPLLRNSMCSMEAEEWMVAGRARSKEFFSTDNFLYNKRVSNRERGRERLNLRQAEPVYDRFKNRG